MVSYLSRQQGAIQQPVAFVRPVRERNGGVSSKLWVTIR